jgi:hypothetical protein
VPDIVQVELTLTSGSPGVPAVPPKSSMQMSPAEWVAPPLTLIVGPPRISHWPAVCLVSVPETLVVEAFCQSAESTVRLPGLSVRVPRRLPELIV